MPNKTASPQDARFRRKVVAVMAVIILGLSAIGFSLKLYELILLVLENNLENGVFAISPTVNYILASAGFICLLAWGACNGMYKNIEAPGAEMLARSQQLDAEMPIERLSSLDLDFTEPGPFIAPANHTENHSSK